MDKLCEMCGNEDCKNRGEDFMNKKLPGCRHEYENPDLYDVDYTDPDDYCW